MTAQVIHSTRRVNGHLPVTLPSTSGIPSQPAISTATLVRTFAYAPPTTVSSEAQNTLATLPPLIAGALNAPGVDLRAISASQIAETLVAAGVDQGFMLGQCPNEVFAVIRGMYSHVRTAYARVAASGPTSTESVAPSSTHTSTTTVTQSTPTATSPVSTASASTAPSTPSTVVMTEPPIVHSKQPVPVPELEPTPVHVVVVDARDFEPTPTPVYHTKLEVEDVQMAEAAPHEEVPPVPSTSSSLKQMGSLPYVSGLKLDSMSPPPSTPLTATSLATPISATPTPSSASAPTETGDSTPTPTRKRKRKSFAALALADVIPRGTDRMTPGKMRALGLASPSTSTPTARAEVHAPSRPSSLARPAGLSAAGRRGSLANDATTSVMTTTTAKRGRGGRLGRRASTSNVDSAGVDAPAAESPLRASFSVPSTISLDTLVAAAVASSSQELETPVVVDIVMGDVSTGAGEDQSMSDVAATSTAPSVEDAVISLDTSQRPAAAPVESDNSTSVSSTGDALNVIAPTTHDKDISLWAIIDTSAELALSKNQATRVQEPVPNSDVELASASPVGDAVPFPEADDAMDVEPQPTASTSAAAASASASAAAAAHIPSPDATQPTTQSESKPQPDSIDAPLPDLDADPTPTPSPSKPAKRTRRPRPAAGTIAPIERTSSRSSASMAAARIAAIASMDENDKYQKPTSPVKTDSAKDDSMPKLSDAAGDTPPKKVKGRPKGKINKKPKSSSLVASDADGEDVVARTPVHAETMNSEPAAPSTSAPASAPSLASPTLASATGTATSPTTTEPKRLTLKLTIPSLAARMQMRTDHGAASDSGSDEENEDEGGDDSSGEDDSGASAAKRPRLDAKSEPPKSVPPPATDSDEEEFEASFMRPRTFGR